MISNHTRSHRTLLLSLIDAAMLLVSLLHPINTTVLLASLLHPIKKLQKKKEYQEYGNVTSGFSSFFSSSCSSERAPVLESASHYQPRAQVEGGEFRRTYTRLTF